MATVNEIKSNAQLVKNATEIGENTAPRVGGVLVDMADHLPETIEQATGTSTTSVMSQKAVTDELAKKANQSDVEDALAGKVDNTDIVQELGDSENAVMSQKAVTDAILNKIDLSAIDFDSGTLVKLAMCQAPTRFNVVKNNKSCGTMEVFSDDMGHMVTEVFETHYTLVDGELGTAHLDDKIFRYMRSYHISGGTSDIPVGTWGEWKQVYASDDIQNLYERKVNLGTQDPETVPIPQTVTADTATKALQDWDGNDLRKATYMSGVLDYEEFSTEKSYAVGDVVSYMNKAYKFIVPHSAGAFYEGQVEETSLKGEIEDKVVFIYSMSVPADTSEWVKGAVYFNQNTNKLRKYLGELLWRTVPFKKDAIYIYEDELYRWDELNNSLAKYYNSILEYLQQKIESVYPLIVPIFEMYVPASSSDWVVNKIYYNAVTKLIRYYDGNNWTTIPFADGAIYSYKNSLYYWDKENEIFIDYYKGKIDAMSVSVKEIESEVNAINNDIYSYSVVDGLSNNIFKLQNTGIIANSSSSNFGNESSLSGDFYACDFIDYVPNTDINVYYEYSFGNFGLVFYDKEKQPLVGYIFTSDNLNKNLKFSHPSAVYFRSSRPNGNGSQSFTYTHKSIKLKIENPLLNKWANKTILFCGTSIPEGGYPQIVGDLLDCNIINKAVGSSVVSAYKRDGSTIQGDNGYRSFSQTIEEKKTLYSTDDYAKYSYESILLPYLDGTNPFPDLIVLEYGSDYNLETNKSEMPLLNEDVTDLGTDTLTESIGVNFNRCTYTGSMLFIINTIYKYNPLARIIVMGFMNKMRRPEQVDAQKTVAEYWQIPFFNVSELLGWSDRVVVGSKDKFNEKYNPTYQSDSDVTQFRMWCPDNWHPHTNTHVNDEGYKESNYELAKKVSSYIQKL